MWAFMSSSRLPMPSMFGSLSLVEGDLPGERHRSPRLVVVAGVEVVVLSEDRVLVRDPGVVAECVGLLADRASELLRGPQVGQREDGVVAPSGRSSP